MLYVLFIFIIHRFLFIGLSPSPNFSSDTHHLLLFAAYSLTLNPLSGCATAGGEETVCESMYRVSPRALLLIYPALHVHFSPQLLCQAVVCVYSIAAFLFAKEAGIKGHLSTFFPLFSIIKDISHSLRNDKYFITFFPPSLANL